jgi:SAM-dependent methyltransferase
MASKVAPEAVGACWPLHAIGRRTHGEIPYMLPRHSAEVDRLDLQHYVLRAALRGNYAVPLDEPRRILDVGSGTGQWGFDLCREFPKASVFGFDIAAGKPEEPANYHLVRGNVLGGLPFADDSFDFVHQRLMMAAISLSMWPRAVGQLVRVTRPGGFVELVELGDRTEPKGPATERMWTLCNALAASRGLDSTGTVLRSLDGYLRAAGMTEVRRHHVAIPLGGWGGTIGSMMATDLHSFFTRLSECFEAELGVPAAQSAELLGESMQECERYRTNAICTVVHGRKPATAPAVTAGSAAGAHPLRRIPPTE